MKISKDGRAVIVEQYKAGGDMGVIAGNFKVTRQRIWQILKAAGAITPRAKKAAEPVPEEVA